jgi:hypothetical protein
MSGFRFWPFITVFLPSRHRYWSHCSKVSTL